MLVASRDERFRALFESTNHQISLSKDQTLGRQSLGITLERLVESDPLLFNDTYSFCNYTLDTVWQGKLQTPNNRRMTQSLFTSYIFEDDRGRTLFQRPANWQSAPEPPDGHLVFFPPDESGYCRMFGHLAQAPQPIHFIPQMLLESQQEMRRSALHQMLGGHPVEIYPEILESGDVLLQYVYGTLDEHDTHWLTLNWAFTNLVSDVPTVILNASFSWTIPTAIHETPRGAD